MKKTKQNNIDTFASTKPLGKQASGWIVIPVDVFMTNVLCFTGSRKELFDSLYDAPVMKNLPKEHIKEIGCEIARCFDMRAKSVAGEVVNYGDIQFIRMSRFNGSIDDICVLLHECLHIAESILRELAIKEHENRTSELLAYLQEFIFKSAMTRLYEQMGFILHEETKK